MTADTENSNRLVMGSGSDLRDVTGRAVDPDCRQPTKMLHLRFATDSNRPAKVRIGNKAEISQVARGKKIGIRFDERPKHWFGKHFRAHRAVEKEIQIILGPARHLLGANFVVAAAVTGGRDKSSAAEDSGSYNTGDERGANFHRQRFIEARPKFQRESARAPLHPSLFP